MNSRSGREGRVWSWAASEAEAEARRRDAHELVGQRITVVRYFTIDYTRQVDLVDSGPRTIDDERELLTPTWLYPGFDAVDYGLEITTASSATFSLTWDPPGWHEGIGFQRLPLLGSAVTSDAGLAIWDVGKRSPAWTQIVGTRVTGVELHYLPWEEERGGLWCPRITFDCHGGRVEVLLGDAEDDVLAPSADNVAVLHPGTSLPAWA